MVREASSGSGSLSRGGRKYKKTKRKGSKHQRRESNSGMMTSGGVPEKKDSENVEAEKASESNMGPESEEYDEIKDEEQFLLSESLADSSSEKSPVAKLSTNVSPEDSNNNGEVNGDVNGDVGGDVNGDVNGDVDGGVNGDVNDATADLENGSIVDKSIKGGEGIVDVEGKMKNNSRDNTQDNTRGEINIAENKNNSAEELVRVGEGLSGDDHNNNAKSVAQTPANDQKIKQLEQKTGVITGKMKNNLDEIMKRDVALEGLEETAGTLVNDAKQFHQTSKKVNRRMWCQNHKWTFIIACSVIVVLAGIGCAVAGSMGAFSKK